MDFKQQIYNSITIRLHKKKENVKLLTFLISMG